MTSHKQKKKAKKNAAHSNERRFELAPLIKLAPELIVERDGNQKFPMLLLALAVVFNDLKGLLLLFEPFAKSPPTHGTISGHAGEWRGLDLQVHRLRVGLIQELLTLIETFETEARGPEMQALMKSAPSNVQKNWQELLDIATRKGSDSGNAFAKVVLQIRNNVAFHYYQPKTLVAGYRKHFFETASNPANEHAYCSIGKNMETTRFYFADAAIDGALSTIQGSMKQDEFLKNLRAVSDTINNALEHILEEYTKPARRK